MYFSVGCLPKLSAWGFFAHLTLSRRSLGYSCVPQYLKHCKFRKSYNTKYNNENITKSKVRLSQVRNIDLIQGNTGYQF